MVKYQRFTLIEREEISRQIASGDSLRKIARSLCRAPSSISREIRQSKVVERKYYRAVFAQQQSNKIRHKLRKNLKLDNNRLLRKFVFSHLKKNWSPMIVFFLVLGNAQNIHQLELEQLIKF